MRQRERERDPLSSVAHSQGRSLRDASKPAQTDTQRSLAGSLSLSLSPPPSLRLCISPTYRLLPPCLRPLLFLFAPQTLSLSLSPSYTGRKRSLAKRDRS